MNKQKILFPIFTWIANKLGYSRESFDYITQYITTKKVMLTSVCVECRVSHSGIPLNEIEHRLRMEIATKIPLVYERINDDFVDDSGITHYRAHILFASVSCGSNISIVDKEETLILCRQIELKNKSILKPNAL